MHRSQAQKKLQDVAKKPSAHTVVHVAARHDTSTSQRHKSWAFQVQDMAVLTENHSPREPPAPETEVHIVHTSQNSQEALQWVERLGFQNYKNHHENTPEQAACLSVYQKIKVGGPHLTVWKLFPSSTKNRGRDALPSQREHHTPRIMERR